MKKPKQMWLVYRPSDDYEHNSENYFICTTEAVAKTAIAKMICFAVALKNRLPDIGEQEALSAAWQAKYDKRERMLDKARWPYGINLKYDVYRSQVLVYCKPLPLREVA